jgi:hypothetical protein
MGDRGPTRVTTSRPTAGLAERVAAAVVEPRGGNALDLRAMAFAGAPEEQHRFLLLVKPELLDARRGDTVRAVLTALFEHLNCWGVSLGGVRVLPPRFNRRRRVVERVYERLASVSSRGFAGLSECHRRRLRDEFGPDADGEEHVRGGGRFLAEQPGLTPWGLSVLTDNIGVRKLGSGVYACRAAVASRRLVLLNSFFPFQLDWLSGGCMVALECFTAHTWDSLRDRVVGFVDPPRAEPASFRRRLFENAESLGLGGLCIAFNGVHVSPGPLEALAQLTAVFGVSLEESLSRTTLGAALVEGLGGGAGWGKVFENPDVETDGGVCPLFELTENRAEDYSVEVARTWEKR